MKLTSEQKHVIRSVIKFPKNIQKIAGYAGTGKSSIVWHLNQLLPNFAVCAFTGKAANVLRLKGIKEATTIHSIIYQPIEENGNVYFQLKNDVDYDGFIIDEGSMVSKELYEDVCWFNKPIIILGDHGQLEPVGQDVYLMKDPDYKLETIHRNAGEIAHFAEFIRKGFRPASFEFHSPKNIVFIEKHEKERFFNKVDQIICAYNKTRVEINKKIRKDLNRNPDWPVKKDRIICLKNNKKLGLFNGMQGVVVHASKRPKNYLEFLADDGTNHYNYFDPSQFNKEKPDFSGHPDDPIPFDYANAITCHKSQGSEFDKIMVIEQVCKNWDHKRWSYTAASRGKKKIIWIKP